MSNPFTFARQRSVAGAKLYFRLTGTSTPQNTYTTPALTTPHSNPVVADANGYFDPIYLDPSLPNYRIIHTDGSNVDNDPTLEVELEPTVDDYPSSSNVSSGYRVKGTRPRIIIEETDAGSNAKKWYIEAQNEELIIGQMDDAESTLTPNLTIPRGTVIQAAPLSASGTTLDISSLKVGHSAIILNGGGTRVSNNTPSADAILQFTSAPAGTYLTEGVLSFTGPSSGNVLIAWPRIATAAGVISYIEYDFSLTSLAGATVIMSSTAQVVDTTVNITTIGTVYGVETATAGQTLGPHWSQEVSNPGNTSMGGWLKVTRLT